jgi:hypothetical protein
MRSIPSVSGSATLVILVALAGAGCENPVAGLVSLPEKGGDGGPNQASAPPCGVCDAGMTSPDGGDGGSTTNPAVCGTYDAGAVVAFDAGLPDCEGNYFLPIQAYPTGSTPYYVATGDFNGDGILDLAVANDGTDTVSVLLGNGDGTFGNKTDYTVGSGPICILAADLNNDGVLDLATTAQNSLVADVLFGDGHGGFGAAQSYPVGPNPNSIAAGDLNGDGWPDLAVTNYSGDTTVTVLINQGDGTFQPLPGMSALTGAIFVAIADFDHDCTADLAVVEQGSTAVRIFPGYGDGGFGPSTLWSFTAGGGPTATALGDYNEDGWLDFAMSDFYGNDLGLLLSDGNGGYVTGVAHPAGFASNSAATADLDGDGHLDLLVANSSSQFLTMLLGHGDGTFEAAPNIPAGNGSQCVVIADFNGDGLPDAVVAESADNGVGVLIHRACR